MSVAVAEQETVICISRDSEECTVYTSDSTMMTKLDKLADPNNDNAPLWKLKEVHRMSGTKEVVGKTYVTNKRLISFRSDIKTRDLTEEQRQEAAERFRKWREQNRKEKGNIGDEEYDSDN